MNVSDLKQRLVESAGSTSALRKVSIEGVTSASDLVGKVIVIKSTCDGQGGLVSLKVNDLPAYPVVGAAPAGTSIYGDGVNTGWVAPGQSYTVVLEENGNSYRFVLMGNNTTMASMAEHGVTQLLTSMTSQSESNAATPKSVSMVKDYVDELAGSIKTKSIMLSKDNWSDYTQTVQVTDLDLTKIFYMGLPTPTGRENANAVIRSELIIESKGTDSLTFSVSETPEININVELIGIEKV